MLRKQSLAKRNVPIQEIFSQPSIRRCYLCGTDSLTGRNYSHRKAWLEQRLKFLAGLFGLDVLGFAILVLVQANIGVNLPSRRAAGRTADKCD